MSYIVLMTLKSAEPPFLHLGRRSQLYGVTWLTFYGSAMLFCCIAGCFDLDHAPATEPVVCYTCTQLNCEEQYQSCLDSPSCIKRYNCLNKCGNNDPNCREKCYTSTPTPTQPMLDLDNCQAASCSDDCDLCGMSMYDGRGPACSRCMQQKCCDLTQACAKDSTCAQAVRERFWCKDPYCVINGGFLPDNIYEQHTSNELLELENCQQKCSDECNLRSEFSCFLNYHIPPAEALNNTSITIKVIDVLEGKVIEKPTIEAFGFEPEQNHGPILPWLDQTYHLKMNGHFNGWFVVSKEGFFPTTVYFNRPLVGNEYWILSMTKLVYLGNLEAIIKKHIDFTQSGILVVTVRDCAHMLAKGIDINYSPEASPKNEIIKIRPDDGSNGPDITTSEMGTILFLNAPPGIGGVTALEPQKKLAISLLDVKVVTGKVSWVNLFPTFLAN